MSCHILFDHFRAVSRMLRHVVSTIVDQKNRDLNSPRGSPCQNGNTIRNPIGKCLRMSLNALYTSWAKSKKRLANLNFEIKCKLKLFISNFITLH